MMTKRRRWLPEYVSEYTDRHGKRRYRFRRKGFAPHHFQHPPGTEGFRIELAACMALEPRVVGLERAIPGSLADLIARYYGSPAFQGMKTSTQRMVRGQLERFREGRADRPVALVHTRHLDAILGKMAATPFAANNLRKRLKRLFAYAVKIEMRPDNPALATDGYKTRGTGFHAWDEADITAFRARHELGSRARLAMELLLWTDQRRADVVKLGRQHVRDGRLGIRQEKTEKMLWIKMAPQLVAAIDAMPASPHLTYLVTQLGASFTSAGFGNWFRERCDEAELKHCTAHGLRKAAARRAADIGATQQQLKAVGGWSSDREVATYTETANQRGLADRTIDAVSAWEVANPSK